MNFLFTLFGLSCQADEPTLLSATQNEATYGSNCELGKSYNAITQECGIRAFDNYVETDCDPDDTTGNYCIETQREIGEQRDLSITVSKSSHLSELLDSMSSVAGTGWGVTMTLAASYVSEKTASSYSVSFYKSATGDSYDRHIKYTEDLKLNDAAKAKLAADPDQFVADYGTHFVSKIIYSNYFIASVKVEQTTSESSSQLGVMATITADDFFALDATSEFNSAATEGTESLHITTEARYNGPEKYETTSRDAETVVDGIMSAYNEWMDNVNSLGEDYAKPTRIVYSPWTELEEVQAMYATEPFPDALVMDDISSTLKDYLHRETIRANADLNAITNLKGWECVQPSYSDLSTAITVVEGQLAAHVLELESLDLAELRALEDQIADGDLSWFTGLSGTHIGEVNQLIMESSECSGGQDEFRSEDFAIHPWNSWSTWNNELRFEPEGKDAFVTGFDFSTKLHGIGTIALMGETIGYQEITEGNQVNGGGGHRTSQYHYKYYEGGVYDYKGDFELKCAKEGMYVAGMHIRFSEVLCACATPNSGGSGWNQRQCTDGFVDWCDSGVSCKQTEPFEKENINKLCENRRRKSGPGPKGTKRGPKGPKRGPKGPKRGPKGPKRGTTTTSDPTTVADVTSDPTLDGGDGLGNSPAGDSYGRVRTMTVHCQPLPVGVYGLPSGEENVSGPYSIKNQAGKVVSNDCPEGYAVTHIDWFGVARAKNEDSDQTKHDSIWTLATEVQFYCRKFSDFLA